MTVFDVDGDRLRFPNFALDDDACVLVAPWGPFNFLRAGDADPWLLAAGETLFDIDPWRLDGILGDRDCFRDDTDLDDDVGVMGPSELGDLERSFLPDSDAGAVRRSMTQTWMGRNSVY